MSHVNKIRIHGLLVFAGLLLISGCGASNTESSFDADTGHPADWVTIHETSFLSSPGQCYECHGDDLGGGISRVSCFSADVNGIACHGPGHGSDWSDPDDPEWHGASAKAAPSTATGFAICQSCHGDDFAGGIVQISCYSCHASAPHSPEPWVYTVRTHDTTDEQNANVCALCHLGESGVTVPDGTPPGCYNNTLCHSTI